MTLLKLANVSKIYRMDGIEVKALVNASLVIGKGEFVAIMGPSGSGKSTLMHIMGLLDTPTSGQVVFEGKDVSRLDEAELAKIRNKKVGFVFQTFNLLARTSALNNVILPMVYDDRASPPQEKDQAIRILVNVGLKERVHHFPSQLSGGEQQRVAIARALINKPAIILADEPTGNLDSKSGKEILEILKDLNQRGNTIVIVTHEQHIAKYAQRTIRIKDGKVMS